MKIHPVGAELFYTKGRTGMQELFTILRTRLKPMKSDVATCLLHILYLKNKQLAPTLGLLNPALFFTTQFV